MPAKSTAFDGGYPVDRVRSVDNNLDVEIPSVETTPADSEIRYIVVTALSINSEVEFYKIDVSVDKGWVTLVGTVNTWGKIFSRE